MKMVMAIIRRSQAEAVKQSLIEAGFSFTFMESRGGMLRQSQQTLFIAIQDTDVKKIIHIIRVHCQKEVDISTGTRKEPVSEYLPRVKARIGSSVIFIWELDDIDAWLPSNTPMDM